MLTKLLYPFGGSQPAQEESRASPGPSSRDPPRLRYATADFTEADDDDEDDSHEEGQEFRRDGRDGRDGRDEDEDEDGRRQSTSVLPLFSATHLDSLPVYSLTHAIRILVQTRTETTLTWEQLRSPQVSQFLVKPMQQQIRTQHFSKATLYALMANCLQFAKEGQLYPGNAGTSNTRSKVCELLTIKLLKEYSTRDLIDALSYDFYPLQGLPGYQTPITPGDGRGKGRSGAARTSTLEVAIRASAKHFLAHPLVVQQLEAIWNGAIGFYSSADNIHRQAPRMETPIPRRQSDPRTPLLASQPGKETQERPLFIPPGRRTATLYDPRNASLMKLSRLRVPRYRQILSTLSLAVLIGLFLAVLIERSGRITTLELVFWFWSAGFMLDELVGFTEQGFSLYIMSFWNVFDLGILLLLIVYYCMRIYGVFLIESHKWNDNAYDILAANAILLLPRIFSILDHYQYFSQLLIAFRLMAVDLAAVFILILISCSGFFVFFTLSRSDNNAADVAYKIFQLLMGFTPAAWDVWPTYDWLGKTLLVLFLIICHFVVVTILITVLTNSFMAVASHANEEHQFLFAINTISMVKNDALFSYVAPSNIFAWILMPLRYCMPLHRFVSLNRLVIKVTHFPLLFCIYVYERYFLASSIYEPTDLVDHPGRGPQRAISLADPTTRTALFSPNVRVREESVVGYQKDRALEEVFRRGPDQATLRTQRRNERRKTQTAIRNWMDQHDSILESPHNYSTIDSKIQQDWQRRLSMNRDPPKRFRQFSEARSVASDPADLMSNTAFPSSARFRNDGIARRDHAIQEEIKDNTDADGDDELVTNDEDEDDNATNTAESRRSQRPEAVEDYFTTPVAGRFTHTSSSSIDPPSKPPPPPVTASPRPPRRGLHNRTLSTNTILYNPPVSDQELVEADPPSPERSSQPRSRPLSNRHTPVDSLANPGRRSPRRIQYLAARPRPILPTRDQTLTAPGRPIKSLAVEQSARRHNARRLSSLDLAIDNQSDFAQPPADETFGAVPSSFVTQMAMATGMMNAMNIGSRGDGNRRDSDRMSRLVLARMKTLEESFADVVREMRVLQRGSGLPSTTHGSPSEGSWKDARSDAGLATIEIAGRDRGEHKTPKRAKPVSRPASRRSMRDGRSDAATSARNKGKGKEVQQSDGDDDLDESDQGPSFVRRGSSF